MPKEKIKVKPIGINKQNIKNNMEKTGLIPNKSYENFILGDDITNYLHFVKKKFINLTFTYLSHQIYSFNPCIFNKVTSLLSTEINPSFIILLISFDRAGRVTPK